MTEQPSLPAIILAGGLSRRMGHDKALFPLAGKALALRVADRLRPQVSTVMLNVPEGHPLSTQLPTLQDTRQDRPGPLAGILAGMKLFAEMPDAPSHLLMVPCDTPFLPRDLVSRLAAARQSGTIILAACAGRVHPVTALWPVEFAEDLEIWLDAPENRRVFEFIARHRSKTVDFDPMDTPVGPLDPFFNINTPEDLTLAEAMLERGEP